MAHFSPLYPLSIRCLPVFLWHMCHPCVLFSHSPKQGDSSSPQKSLRVASKIHLAPLKVCHDRCLLLSHEIDKHRQFSMWEAKRVQPTQNQTRDNPVLPWCIASFFGRCRERRVGMGLWIETWRVQDCFSWIQKHGRGRKYPQEGKRGTKK